MRTLFYSLYHMVWYSVTCLPGEWGEYMGRIELEQNIVDLIE